MKKTTVDATTFVTIWQTSSSLSQAAKKAKMNKTAMTMRANLYRHQGVPLRKFADHAGKPPVNDYKELARLAKKLARSTT